jgi:hypothetical protein
MIKKEEHRRKLRIVAADLFMLCRRATAALNRDDVEKAKEILSHAQRIAEKVGIKENILRALDS